MVGELHALGLVGMQHRGVELDQRAIFPKRAGMTPVEPEFFSDDGQLMITRFIGEIARAELIASHI